MEKKIILGLVGQLSSGKGTVAKYIEEKYGATTFRYSTMLRDVLRRLFIEISRENLQEISTLLRKKFGEDLFAKVMAEEVKGCSSNIIVIDGIRRLADIKYLNEIPNFKLVRIDASPEIRFNRIKSRNENVDDKNKTFEQFLEDQKKEADIEIPTIMEQAKLSIDNNNSLEDLHKNIDELLTNIDIN